MIKFDRKKTCCVSGHRKIKPDLDISLLKAVFRCIINGGTDTFLIGMAVGFDTICFEILESLKDEYKFIKLVACVPCLGQENSFSEEQKREYYRMLDKADEKIILSDKYTKTCMQLRNMFMVDNSSKIVVYIRENRGGTANTVNYAKKQGIDVIRV